MLLLAICLETYTGSWLLGISGLGPVPGEENPGDNKGDDSRDSCCYEKSAQQGADNRTYT